MEGLRDDDRQVIHAEWGRHWSGGVNQVFLLARGLHSVGVAVGLVCPQGAPLAERAAAAGVPVTQFPLRGEHDLLAWWRFARWLRQSRLAATLSLLHAHSRRGLLPTLFVASCLKVPTVVHWRVGAPMPRWVVRWADHIIAVSHTGAAAALRAGAFPERVTVIHSVIEPDIFAPDPRMRSRARDRWGITEEAFVLAAVGRLVAGKGYEILLEAVALMAPEERPLLLLAGEGWLRPHLERLVQRWRLEKWVRFLGFQADVRWLLWAADAFVHVPTHFPEGTPNAILEAMAAGLPVVATPIGGIGEIIQHGTTGWLTPPNDLKALVEALRLLRANPPLRHRLGKAAQTYVREHHGLDHMVERVQAVYAAVLQERLLAAQG